MNTIKNIFNDFIANKFSENSESGLIVYSKDHSSDEDFTLTTSSVQKMNENIYSIPVFNYKSFLYNSQLGLFEFLYLRNHKLQEFQFSMSKADSSPRLLSRTLKQIDSLQRRQEMKYYSMMNTMRV